MCAQKTTKATVADARCLNKVVAMAVNRPELGIVVHRNRVRIDDCEIICWADSAFANAEGEKSQHGVCFGLAPKGESSKMSSSGDLSNILPLMAFSSTVKRRVRSTLAAEAYAVSEGVEWCQVLRYILLELAQPPKGTGSGSVLQQISKIRDSYPVTVHTDSDNLTKSCRFDSGAVKDKRLRIVIAMLREVLEIEPWTKILWISTNRMFADALTKIDSPLTFLVEGFMHAAPVRFPPTARKTARMHEG